MRKILTFFGMLLLIAEMFDDNNCVRALMPYPYFRNQRYQPFRGKLQPPLLLIRTLPIAAMDHYLKGTVLTAQKRSQPDNDFDYVDEFDPTQIFL
ncbi:hypothetical protein ACH3XW_19705 [Acanthocheilonema viteae]|uniref:Uncharacterized protein n=1 Tax=Acanthocheilonema viteae TaxID=6277 RepID=A0A498SH37_ACAVI|nr:unnamed protein product [Acanthocheilonema viteae]